jgi:hypothetical protein
MTRSTRSANEERIEILLLRTEVVQSFYEQVRSISITYKSLCEFAKVGSSNVASGRSTAIISISVCFVVPYDLRVVRAGKP